MGLELLSDNGVMLISEFAHLSPRSRRGMAPKGPVPLDSFRTIDFWHIPHSYRTFIVDKAHPDGIGLQEIAQYADNSRCSRATIMPATLALGRKAYTFAQLIKRAG